MELKCRVQNYDWGQIGRQSLVAQLISSADSTEEIDPSKSYAELWMGTHENGPSIIKERDVLLSEYIKDNHDAIGPDVISKFDVSIPFLFKILSIRKALSIQAHPNKEHAAKLHKEFPDLYKDPNHKPELAITLSQFEALCGVRPISQIQKYLEKLTALTDILDKDSVDNLMAISNDKNDDESETAVKKVFKSLMMCNKKVISESLQKHLDALKIENDSNKEWLMQPLINRLHDDYPGDVGCWTPYFLNYMNLNPSSAIFIKPNVPHAYIKGDCMEIMACSDNVVRAGLTPKLIDVPTLVEMLDYRSYTVSELLVSPKVEDDYCIVWRPPVPEFAIVKITLKEPGVPYNSIIRSSPSIILITGGSGAACDTEPVPCRPGVVLFLKASRQITLTPANDSYIEAYQAICNV